MEFCVSTVHVEKASVRSCVVTTKNLNHKEDFFSLHPRHFLNGALCGIPTTTDSFCTFVVMEHSERLLR